MIRIEIDAAGVGHGLSSLIEAEKVLVSQLNEKTGVWEKLECVNSIELEASSDQPFGKLTITQMNKSTVEKMLAPIPG